MAQDSSSHSNGINSTASQASLGLWAKCVGEYCCVAATSDDCPLMKFRESDETKHCAISSELSATMHLIVRIRHRGSSDLVSLELDNVKNSSD
jgi:hypothetical protein